MDVTNAGSVAGKDVVQVYAQSPYTDYDRRNRVEKAAQRWWGTPRPVCSSPARSRPSP